MQTTRAILPREYGAYAELAFPLLTAFLSAGASVAGVGFALAVTAVFLVREPLAVLNGVRGARLEASLGAPARRATVALGVLGGLGGMLGMVLAPPVARLWALVPGGFALLLAPALFRGRPKTLAGEVLVACALAGMILPIGLAGHMPLQRALEAATVWAVSFTLATLAVHAIKARHKPELGATWTRWATPAFGGLAVAIGMAGAVAALWPWRVGWAVLPSAVLVIAALSLCVHPRQLKRVGWSLAGANLITLGLLLLH